MSRKKHYSSDLTDREWTILEPLIPAAKKGGRPRTANMREALNGIFYVLKTGCQWEKLPKDFPPSGTVFYYFNTWRRE
jgi:putative transposase